MTHNGTPVKVMIPVAPGELFDKISILAIKQQRIADEVKLVHIKHEFEQLAEISLKLPMLLPTELYDRLLDINKKLWDAEEVMRLREEQKVFDAEYIECTRKDAYLNDQRFLAKQAINQYYGSDILEQKSYKEEVLSGKSYEQDNQANRAVDR